MVNVLQSPRGEGSPRDGASIPAKDAGIEAFKSTNDFMFNFNFTITQSFAADTAIQGRTLGPIKMLEYDYFTSLEK